VGYVKVRAEIWNIDESNLRKDIELLADIGAIYTVVPASVLNQLKIRVIGKRKFRLANNEVVERDIGIIGIKINDLTTHSIVIFGDENVYFLGTVTLEELGLKVNPVTGKLEPLELLLMYHKFSH